MWGIKLAMGANAEIRADQGGREPIKGSAGPIKFFSIQPEMSSGKKEYPPTNPEAPGRTIKKLSDGEPS
jgi:hypothetical protein